MAVQERIELYPHDDYILAYEDWTKYRDLYDGKHRVLTDAKYLWPHIIEQATKDGAALRQIRQQRSRYTNFIEPLISTYLSMFFKNDPNFEEVKNLFGEEINDIDGTGKHLTSFIKDVTVNYLLYGKPIIYVDAFNLGARSRAEEVQLGQRPFMYVLHPLEVMDWAFDTSNPRLKGKYSAIRWEYYADEPRTDLRKKNVRNLYSKELFLDGDKYRARVYRQVTEAKGSRPARWEEVSDNTLPNWDQLPIAFADTGASWVKDTSEAVLRYFNKESTYDNIHNNQAYQRTFLIGNLEAKDFKVIGEYAMAKLPEGTVVHTIEPSDTASLERGLEQCATNIYKIAFNRARQLPADSRAVQGEGTLQEEKDDLVSLIISSLQDIEDVMNQAVKLYAKFKGESNFTGKISFDKNIKPEDIEKQMRLYAGSRDLIAMSPAWKKAVAKKFARAMNLGDDIGQIETEIDQAKDVVEGEETGEATPQVSPVQQRLRQMVNGRQAQAA